MSSTTSLLTEKIVKDRVYYLFKLYAEFPLHKVVGKFKEKYGLELPSSLVEKTYKIWAPVKGYSNSFILERLRDEKHEGDWNGIEQKIEKQVNEEIADFIYHHWKQYKDKK